MAFYDKFPYTNFQDLNLDWLAGQVGNVHNEALNAQASAEQAAAHEQGAGEQATNAANAANEAAQAQQRAQQAEAQAASSAAGVTNAVNQINTNTERIDNILVSGTPTEGNAELIDIRVGANGVTYPTAGDAVRGQYNALDAENDLIRENLTRYNSYIISEDDMSYPYNVTRYGLTFSTGTNDPFKRFQVVGTATQAFSLNMISGSATSAPSWFIPGKRIYVDVPEVNGIFTRVYAYFQDGTRETKDFYRPGVFAVPDGTVGCYIQTFFEPNVSINTQYYIRICGSLPNSMIDSAEPLVVNNNFYNYENTYNVTATPEITADEVYYLAPSEDPTTDRTADIAAVLAANHIVKLGSGTYRVRNLDLTDNDTIIGCGNNTVIELDPDASVGYAIKLSWYNRVENVMISGGDTDYHLIEEAGYRYGIMFEGNVTPSGVLTDLPRYCDISNVFIKNFSGAGIECRNSGTPEFTNLQIVNCRMMWNHIGIDIARRSEYHNIANCSINDNYIGIVNNGGNNTFTNCNITRNVTGILMDNSSGDMYNNSHGAYIGCKINHNGANNDGYAVRMNGMENGMIFSGCNIWYGAIEIVNCRGVIMNNMNCGNQSINVRNSSTLILTGNMYLNPPTVNKDANCTVVFNNCYTQSGNVVNP